MKYRIAWFVALAVGLAALFVRLGFWQLDRLAERRAENATKRALLAQPMVPFQQLGAERERRLRRAFVAGAPDYDREFVVTGRSRNGSPGVHILTPVRVAGSDSAVLVNRGWVYAADAATADLARWREPRTEFRGHTESLPVGAGASRAPAAGRAVRMLSSSSVAAVLPYPVHTTYVIVHDSGGEGTPARLPEPALDEGPHLSYAIQWFCFAAIAIGGAAAVLVSRRNAGSRAPARGSGFA